MALAMDTRDGVWVNVSRSGERGAADTETTFDRLSGLGYAPPAFGGNAVGRVWAGWPRAPREASRPQAWGGEPGLAEVRVGENETFESALRRFNKKIQQSGILAEARRREHYEKPSVKRKRKEAKRKKNARTQVG